MFLGQGMPQARAFSVTQLPPPGTLVGFSPVFVPILARGLVTYPDQPFNFDLLVDTGTARANTAAVKADSQRMMTYFLAALTLPAEDPAAIMNGGIDIKDMALSREGRGGIVLEVEAFQEIVKGGFAGFTPLMKSIHAAQDFLPARMLAR
jgi:hypothetical protein